MTTWSKARLETARGQANGLIMDCKICCKTPLIRFNRRKNGSIKNQIYEDGKLLAVEEVTNLPDDAFFGGW